MKSFTKPKIGLLLFFVFLAITIIFICFAQIALSFGYNASRTAASINNIDAAERLTVVIDAGHGGEDPGAVVDDIKEKDLNLQIAKKLYDFLKLSDINVVMTRSEDVLLYDQGQEASKKQYDLKNRVKIAESYENCIFISIHMNKFPLESCKGLQVFYSDNNPQSEILADTIRINNQILQSDNTRSIKNGSPTIYILERTSKPAVLIECGFISNSEDRENLTDSSYQNKLAYIIYNSIMQHYEEQEKG